MKALLNKSFGFSLIELIVSIVIISVMAVGTMSAISTMNERSADPMLRLQSLAIAEAYMEEILSKPFNDPTSATACPAAPGSRTSYDNICDYDGITNADVEDQNGNAIAQLAAYSISVDVVQSANLNGASANNLRVDISVSDPVGNLVRISGYRTNY